MPSAGQLKALLKSHAEADDDRFYSVAMQVAAHEARAGGGLDHKSAQDRPIDVGVRAQGHVLQGVGCLGAERGGRIYDQGRERL